MPLVLLPFPTLIAAALPPHPGFRESIVFQLNGLVVVFLALASIWAVLELTGIYFRRTTSRPKAAPAPLPPPAPIPAGLSLKTVAAISAAVCVVIDSRHRIHAIVPLAPDLDWAHEGRRQIFASHHVR
jgi:hypothetical protein